MSERDFQIGDRVQVRGVATMVGTVADVYDETLPVRIRVNYDYGPQGTWLPASEFEAADA